MGISELLDPPKSKGVFARYAEDEADLVLFVRQVGKRALEHSLAKSGLLAKRARTSLVQGFDEAVMEIITETLQNKLEKDELISTQEAADILSVSRPTVVRLTLEKKLSCTRVGKHRRLNREEVERYLKSRTTSGFAAVAELGICDDLPKVLDHEGGKKPPG